MEKERETKLNGVNEDVIDVFVTVDDDDDDDDEKDDNCDDGQ